MSQINIESEQLSFYSLFAEKQLRIEIPIIQRDYAQGRKSAKEVRTGFLNALFNYLNEGIPFRDLDFVYGDLDKKGNLILLDGQQRLTTLFLLHWYLSIKDKENNYEEFKNKLLEGDDKSKFTYKTRQSSTDFCNALLKNGINLDNLLSADDKKTNSISKTIKDCSWYFLSWGKDPTVNSMLNMLDAIHEKFKKCIGFYKKLIDLTEPVITFQFLALTDHGLTDDLYIKMNSRGKPLTRFENFKAKFEQHLTGEPFKSREYILDDREEGEKEVNTNAYFSHKIDTHWTDLFWLFKIKTEKEVNNEIVIDYEIDKLMMNFISTVAINHTALSQNKVKHLIDNQSNLSYNIFSKLDDGFSYSIIDVLDILSGDKKLNTFLNDFYYYNELESFKKIINKSFTDAGYLERIQFFAYYSFLAYNEGEITGFADWMRVIVNLSENTSPYNDDTEFINSIRSINSSLVQSQNILEYLRTEDSQNIKGFNSYQIKEERIKAHLLNKSDEWLKCILEFEQQGYFKGQLTFALSFSGIETFYNKNNNCNWSSEEDIEFKTKFDNYVSEVFTLFDSKGLQPEALKQHRIHMATLSKGNYLLFAKSNHSFLIDSNRDVSWKRLLLGGDEKRDEKRDFFKQVIDDPNFDSKNLTSLETIANNFDENINNWRIKFIQNPELFEFLGSFKYIRFSNGLIYLVKGIKLSGEHAELFSFSLFNELKKEVFFNIPKPFEETKYFSPSGEAELPCLYLHNFKNGENDFALDINYNQNENYKLKFFDRNRKEILDNIKTVLELNGFTQEENFFENIIPESELKNSIIKLCETLNEIE